MQNPNLAEIVARVNELLRPPDPAYISETALAVGVIRQMAEHERHDQPMPTYEELRTQAARHILAARGVITLELAA